MFIVIIIIIIINLVQWDWIF